MQILDLSRNETSTEDIAAIFDLINPIYDGGIALSLPEKTTRVPLSERHGLDDEIAENGLASRGAVPQQVAVGFPDETKGVEIHNWPLFEAKVFQKSSVYGRRSAPQCNLSRLSLLMILGTTLHPGSEMSFDPSPVEGYLNHERRRSTRIAVQPFLLEVALALVFP